MRRTTLMACDFGYGDASFQLAIEDALLQQRHSVEAEPIGALNLYIHKLPNEVLAIDFWALLWRRRKFDNLVRARSGHQARGICFAKPFAKHFQPASNQAFENPAIGFVYLLEQIVIALFFDVFVDLIGHFRRRSVAPWRVTKHKSI